MTGPLYERIVPAPDREFVLTVVEQGLGDFLGTWLGKDFIGYPRTQRITDSVRVMKISEGSTPGEHGVSWWNLLDPHEGGEEWTDTQEAAETAYLRTRVELMRRPPSSRRFICLMRWQGGLPADLESLG